jgi:Parvulin-like peptidyl-prolyl isomerase
MKRKNYFKLFVLAVSLLPVVNVQAQSKLDKKVLMKIGDENITVKDFRDVYDKNNLNSEVVEKKSVDDYLDLFINFRMKVKEAKELELDTSAKFKKELDGYRQQLAKPYFTNEEVSEELVEEAYQRKLKDIRASHILIRCDKHALPSDTLKAFKRAMDLRKRILNGEDFGIVAAECSDDPSARDMKGKDGASGRKGNHGDLGYFTVFDMVYPFETGAYNTKVGEVSMPVRSDFGYHLIKVESLTDAVGVAQAAHIFLALPQDADPKAEQEMLDKANNIYNEIMAKEGKTWNEAVKQYTEDRGTVARNGELSKITVSRIVPEFIAAIKEMKPGEISKPVRTSYGYHIIKLIGTSGVGTFENEKQNLEERIAKDMRSKKTEEVVLNQIKKESKFKQYDETLNAFMASVDSTILTGKYVPSANLDLNGKLFSIGDQNITVNAFVEYINEKQTLQKYVTPVTYAYQLYEDFMSARIMDYADSHLEEKYPDFKLLVQEYYDGILLFDLMEKQVWTKAVQDTAGLQAFHARNADKYLWGDRVEAAVITVTRPESLQQVKDYINQGVPMDSLRAVIVRDSLNYVYVRKGFYQKEDNQFVDQTEWKEGVLNEIPSTVDKSTVIVKILQVRGPEPKTLKEARGIVTSDYQVELEQKWVESLHQKYPVEIDQKVLEKVRKLYK